MTDVQKIQNEKFFMQIMSMSKSWVWADLGHRFEIVDGKLIAPNSKAKKAIREIVRRSFFEKFVK